MNVLLCKKPHSLGSGGVRRTGGAGEGRLRESSGGGGGERDVLRMQPEKRQRLPLFVGENGSVGRPGSAARAAPDVAPCGPLINKHLIANTTNQINQLDACPNQSICHIGLLVVR